MAIFVCLHKAEIASIASKTEIASMSLNSRGLFHCNRTCCFPALMRICAREPAILTGCGIMSYLPWKDEQDIHAEKHVLLCSI